MIYPAKTLFPGTAIGLDAELHLVGVPNNKPYTRAYFHGEYMTIKGHKCLGMRTFPDKFGRDKLYKLSYYEWKPDMKQVEDYTEEGMAKLHAAMAQLFKREVRTK